MKTLKTVITLLTMAYTFNASAQSSIKQGAAIYKCQIQDENLPEGYDALMPDSISMFFKNEKLRTETNIIGGNVITISNDNTHITASMYNLFKQKFYTLDTASSNEADENNDNIKIQKSNETRVINGYLCNKVFISVSDSVGNTDRMVIFYNKDLPTNGTAFGISELSTLNGFLMAMDANIQGVKMSLTCIKLDITEQAESLFVVPTGYVYREN